MKKLIALGLCLLISLLNLITFTHAATNQDQVGSMAGKYLEANPQAGLVVGIIDGDQKWVFGYGKISAGNPSTPNGSTLFEIGSITKTFSALLAANLVVQGKWRLDDPVEKYLTETKIPAFKGQKITLRHLLNHTSALPRIPSDLYIGNDFDATNPYRAYTKKSMLEYVSRYQLIRKPGTEYEYSNLGFGLLGLCLEKVTGKAYETLLVETICNPFNLSDTRINLTQEQKKRLATGHSVNGKETSYWDFDAMDSAGALKSNANDLLLYTRAQMGQSESGLKEAIKLCHNFDYKKGTIPVALSWHGNKNKEIWLHSGGTGGFRSFLAFTKSTPKAVVVLAGSENSVDELGISLFEANVSGKLFL